MSEKKKIPKFLRGILTNEDLSRIADAIKEVEKKSSGEVRVSIHEKKHRKEKHLTLIDLAAKEFHKLGMQKTKEGTGVLLYFLFSERKFQILADAGIYSKVPQLKWDEIALDISNHFKSGKFFDGIHYGIDECGKLLAKEFPVRHDDVNELPNEVSIS